MGGIARVEIERFDKKISTLLLLDILYIQTQV